MSQSQIESFGLRRSAAVATAVYCVLFVAAIAYAGSTIALDATFLAASTVALLMTAPACYLLLVRQWRELGIEAV